MDENFYKNKAESLFFGVISCIFLPVANTGLSPALLMIGLILAKEQMVEDSYLTSTLTVIK